MLITSLPILTLPPGKIRITHIQDDGAQEEIFSTTLAAPPGQDKIPFRADDIIRAHMRARMLPIATYDINGQRHQIIHNIIPDSRTEQQIKQQIQQDTQTEQTIPLTPCPVPETAIRISYSTQHLTRRTAILLGKWEEKSTTETNIATILGTPCPTDSHNDQTIEITTAPLPGSTLQEARLIGIPSPLVTLSLPWGAARYDLDAIIEKSELSHNNTPGEAPVLKLTLRPLIPEGRLIGLSHDSRIFTPQFEPQFK